MGSVALVATRTGVLSYRTDGPGSAWEPQGKGLDDQWVWVTVIDPTDPSKGYAGTRTGGLFATDDFGKSWSHVDGGPPYEYVRGLAIHPSSPDVLYVGTEPATVFRYSRSTGTWTDTPVRELSTYKEWTFPDEPHIPHVKSMTVDPRHPDSVYAAVEEGWVIRTDDGGKSWVELTKGMDFDAHFVCVDPVNAGRVYCATGQQVYVSDKRGEDWEEIPIKLPRRYASVLMLHPEDPDILYLAATDGPPPEWFTRDKGGDAGLYVSKDRARTWTELRGGLPELLKDPITAVVADPQDASTLYLSVNNGTVWISRDAGNSWSQMLEGLGRIQGITMAEVR